MDFKDAMAIANVEDLPDVIVITLRQPIEHAEGTYSELKVREPTFGQLEEFSGKSAIEQMSIVTNAPIGLLKKVGSRDANKLTAALSRFL